ncbi:MAG: tetratricopeptide repeat protein [Candidatus Obscuribacterales bacterium]
MRIAFPTCARCLLAALVVIFDTTFGAYASGGNRTRIFLVPPAAPEAEASSASSGASSSSNSKAVVRKTESQKARAKMDAAVAFYKAGSFEKAVPLFQALLLVEPTNAQAHYYYANCLAREGQNSAARFEYQSSLRYSKSAELTDYSNQALKNLAALPSSKLSEKSAADSADKLIESPSQKVTGSASNQAKAAHFDQQLERLRAEVNAEYRHKLDEKKSELNRKISKIRQEADEEINSTPRFFPAHMRTQNTNYETTIVAIQAKADTKIKILTSDYQDEFRLIDETYGKRLEALASSHQNLKGQMGATVGSSQVTPNGTSFYVRNYVNFGGVQESIKAGATSNTSSTSNTSASPGLRAVPGKLKPF